MLKKFFSLFAMIFVLSACGGGNSVANAPVTEASAPEINAVEQRNSRIAELWSGTVSPFLSEPLWSPIYNYDAVNVLMGPMHWAFSDESREQYRSEFEEFFDRYIDEGVLDQDNELRKLQYLYLLSQYVKLVVLDEGQLSATASSMLQQLYDEIMFQAYTRSMITYGNNPVFTGMIERIEWKLNNFAPEPERARALIDEDLFFLAISSDLYFVNRMLGTDDSQLLQIRNLAHRAYTAETLDVGDGVLFQPGVWSHHPDYKYAGNEQLAPDLQPMIIEDIPTDSSHIHRMPLWLLSLLDTFEPLGPEYQQIKDIHQRLLWQFENVIFEPASEDFPALRLNNYSDGYNGVYRYQYSTTGGNLGYGPYDVSGTLPYGWYVFSGSSLLSSEFQSLTFPLEQQVVTQYVGPNSTRERHPLVRWPDYFQNGFAELSVLVNVDLINNKCLVCVQ